MVFIKTGMYVKYKPTNDVTKVIQHNDSLAGTVNFKVSPPFFDGHDSYDFISCENSFHDFFEIVPEESVVEVSKVVEAIRSGGLDEAEMERIIRIICG